MRVVISAGGTGGHIYPALAILNKIKEMEPDSEFIYIGTHNRMEKDIVPAHGINYVPIEIYGLAKNLKLGHLEEITMAALLHDFYFDKDLEEYNAYEKLKGINSTKGKENKLESLILKTYNLKSFIKIKDDQISVIISSKNSNVTDANNIIRTIQKEFDKQMYITVKYQ